LLSRRIALIPALAAVVAAAIASTASASPGLRKGIFDEANTLYGDPPRTFPILKELGTRYVRMNLHWGGRFGVAGVDPTVRPTDPNDGQYDWGIYDRAVQYAAENGIQVVFSIVNSPPWANGGRAPRFGPTNMTYLRDFAYAAALRYSGTYRRPSDGIVLPPVRHWLAWNEPNNPIWLQPQVSRGRFVSPRNYARICNAIVTGVKATLIRGEKVACGVTAPRGNNNPRASRQSLSPLPFIRGMKRYGARGFDAYAHHPYYGRPIESPTKRGTGSTAVTLANINDLDKELRRLYGAKRIWITEYGYQTRPDRVFAVTYAKQAAYMKQAWTIAKRHPRIDMFLWFMLKDDTNISLGWQSGVLTAGWARKPSFNTFRSLR
jgi:hypothetical protein